MSSSGSSEGGCHLCDEVALTAFAGGTLATPSPLNSVRVEETPSLPSGETESLLKSVLPVTPTSGLADGVAGGPNRVEGGATSAANNAPRAPGASVAAGLDASGRPVTSTGGTGDVTGTHWAAPDGQADASKTVNAIAEDEEVQRPEVGIAMVREVTKTGGVWLLMGGMAQWLLGLRFHLTGYNPKTAGVEVGMTMKITYDPNPMLVNGSRCRKVLTMITATREEAATLRLEGLVTWMPSGGKSRQPDGTLTIFYHDGHYFNLQRISANSFTKVSVEKNNVIHCSPETKTRTGTRGTGFTQLLNVVLAHGAVLATRGLVPAGVFLQQMVAHFGAIGILGDCRRGPLFTTSMACEIRARHEVLRLDLILDAVVNRLLSIRHAVGTAERLLHPSRCWADAGNDAG